jgi:hypothetical protein
MRNILAALLVVLMSTTAFAQEAPKPPEAPKASQAPKSDEATITPGTQYKPLTFWTNLKIGAAYYTSPGAVADYSFAYTYDPKKDSSISASDIDNWVSTGKAKMAVVKEGGVVEAVKTDGADDWKSFLDKNNGSAVLISPSSTLGGINYSNAVFNASKKQD